MFFRYGPGSWLNGATPPAVMASIGGSERAELPAVWIVAAREVKGPGQRRLVPAHAPASIGHGTQRHRVAARRKGVIGELTFARQNFGPGIKERTRLHGDPRAGAIDWG